MATYRNNNTENVDTFSSYADGVVSGKVGYIRPSDRSIEAENLPGALRILAGVESGRYVKKSGFVLVTTPPPAPDPTPTPTPSGKNVVEVFVDGVSVFRQELP